VEQALRDPACVAHRVAQSDYAGLYRSVYGHNLFEIEYPYDVEEACAQEGGHLDMPEGMREKVEAEYDNIALAIAAFQSSPRVNQFSSKFDGSQTGWLGAGLTEQEQLGFELFTGAASCGFCHRATGDRPLFTDFRYNNIGVPINPENPALLADPGFRDPGLGGFLETQPEWAALAEANRGLVKTPTVRNVDRRPFPGAVKAFMHNGYFKTLEQVVNFYNTRDVKPECPNPLTPADEAMAQGCWPAPEVAANENQFIGDLGLTAEEEAAIVAFLKTLNDGYLPPAVAAN
jgi:cytochrome c peroxidase